MKRVSVIIVTYNSEQDIFDCINSIRKYADIPLEDVELVVVDNGSLKVDKMFDDLCELWGEDIVLLKNTHNGGYGQGNNIGIRHSSASVILIMNPDVRLASPFFAKPLNAFESDTKLCMYGMKQMLTEKRESRSSFMCTLMMNGYLRTLMEAVCNRLDFYIPRWQYFSGSCFFVRRNMFEDVGLFDESVFMYGEEDDIHWRLMHRWGANFRYDKSMHYLHLTSERQPDFDYEMNIIQAALKPHAKNGYPLEKSLRNFRQIYRCRYWRERFLMTTKGDNCRMKVLQRVLNKLKEM